VRVRKKEINPPSPYPSPSMPVAGRYGDRGERENKGK